MIVKTYKELEEWIEMFKKQNADLIIIKSSAGLGKTSLLKKMMGLRKDWTYINGHTTPLKTYKNLYYKCNAPVVFDDLDTILSDSRMLSLLKSLADTCRIKEMNWHTTSKLIKGVPETFDTTSNVCILLNEFDLKNTTLLPLIDRAFYIEFEPSREEILMKIKEIDNGKNKEIIDFIEQNYKIIDNLTLRTFVKAVQLFKDNPVKWKENFMNMVGFDEKLVQYIQLQEKYQTQKERLKEWKWHKSTYFRIKAKEL